MEKAGGGYFVGRLRIKAEDKIIFLSSPHHHTGKSLSEYFKNILTDGQKKTNTSFAISIDPPYKQLPINRFRYIQEGLEYIGDEEFTNNKKVYHSCKIYIYGKDDPMFRDFSVKSGYHNVERTWVLSMSGEHDVASNFVGLFNYITGIECR